MPTYEYVCKSCGHLFEIVQSMRDDPLTECPRCGGELRKVFTAPAIAFKGSGFYATDARRSATGSQKEKPQEKKPSSEGGAAGTKTEKSSEKSSETSSEKKSDTSTGSSSGSSSGSSDRGRTQP